MSFARILKVCAPLALAAFTATPAWCTLINTYTDPTLWLANVTGANTTTPITFGDLAITGNYKLADPSGTVTRNGVEFDGLFNSTPALRVYSNTYTNPYYDFGSDGGSKTGYLGTNSGVPMSIDIYLPAGVTAFGTDLMSYGAGFNVSIVVDGATYSSPTTLPHPNRVFFGQTYTTPINHLSFTLPTYTVLLLDNFRFGAAGTQQQDPPPSDSPEPVTMFMIGSGLLFVHVMRRRLA